MGKKIILFPTTGEDHQYGDRPRVAAGSLMSWATVPDRELAPYTRTEEYPGSKVFTNTIVWVPKREWTGHLTIMGYSRGRSAAGWELRAANDTEYYMFMTDLMDCIKRLTITAGMMYGRWEFIKRGANYGVRLVPDV